MIHVSRTPEFSNCGNMNSIPMCTSSDQDLGSMAGSISRQRSHSYYSPEDSKNYGVQTQTEETNQRPRSRYVFSFNLKSSAVLLFFFNPSYVSDQTTGSNRHVYLHLCGFVFNVVAKLDNRQTVPNTKKRLKRSTVTKYVINTESTAPQVLLHLRDVRALL